MKGSVTDVKHGQDLIAVAVLFSAHIQVTVGAGNAGCAVAFRDEDRTAFGRVGKTVQDTQFLCLRIPGQAQKGKGYG